MILLQVPAHFFLYFTSNTHWAGALLLGRAFVAIRSWAARMFDQELFVDEGDERPLFWVALQQVSPLHPRAHEAGSGTSECFRCVG
ncbi:MAG: hypothetical protein NW202_01980 [Nitrospira sp.]|nr:hypothetical protein [Nitrospira sp.]